MKITRRYHKKLRRGVLGEALSAVDQLAVDYIVYVIGRHVCGREEDLELVGIDWLTPKRQADVSKSLWLVRVFP